jgi:hypothetical protein
VNEAVAGSSPVDPPSFGAVAERRMHFAVDEDDDGSSPSGPAMRRTGFPARSSDLDGVESPSYKINKGENNYVCTQESAGLYTGRDMNFQLFLVR